MLKDEDIRVTGRIAMTLAGVGSHSVLCCPNCGENTLRHEEVIVFDRQRDAEELTRTVVRDGLVASHLIESDGSENPSARRHGIVIRFSCELCNAQPIELRFAQRKGETHVTWRYVKHQTAGP